MGRVRAPLLSRFEGAHIRLEWTMIELRPYSDLGSAKRGGLRTRYHFSFADYHSPERMHWGNLRAWNDDTLAPKTGFPLHAHAGTEIITYVRTGAVTHQDSLGNHGRTEAGEVQVMSAGTGIHHTEYNLEDVDTRIFQIWLLPQHLGGIPRCSACPFPKADRGRFVILASGAGGGEGGIKIRADARVLGATVEKGDILTYTISPGRYAYLVLASGAARIGDVVARTGDGIAMRDIETLTVLAVEDSEILLVDTA